MTKKNIIDPKEMEKVSGGMIIDPLNPPHTDLPLGELRHTPIERLSNRTRTGIKIVNAEAQDDGQPGGVSTDW